MQRIKVPIVETNRLIIRPITKEDAYDLYEITSNPNVTRFLTYSPHMSVDESLQSIEERFINADSNNFETYCVELKSNKKMIGMCNFISKDYDQVVIGYQFNEDYWNQGIATEALNKVVEVAFNNLEISRIEISHATENIGSQRVIEKAGFKLVGTKRHVPQADGTYLDIKIYDLLKEDLYV